MSVQLFCFHYPGSDQTQGVQETDAQKQERPPEPRQDELQLLGHTSDDDLSAQRRANRVRPEPCPVTCALRVEQEEELKCGCCSLEPRAVAIEDRSSSFETVRHEQTEPGSRRGRPMVYRSTGLPPRRWRSLS